MVFITPRQQGWWRRFPGSAGFLADDEKQRRRRKLILFTLFAALAVTLPAGTTPWKLMDARAFDFLSTVSPPPRPADGPIVVAIDEPSFAELGLQWPWPRSLHAKLVEALRRAGAKAIGLDIVFAEPSADPDADAALAAALGPDVVLAADESLLSTPQAEQVVRTEPLPAFTANGAATGIASVSLDKDGTLRRVSVYPDGFAAELLRKAGKAVADPPADGLLQSWGPNRTYPTVSFYQALDPQQFLPPGFFRDRVVMVGLSTQAAPDINSSVADTFATSFTPRTGKLVAGVEVQANTFDNLGHGLFLRPLPFAASAALGFFAALLGGAAVWRGTGWHTLVWCCAAVVLCVAGSFLALRFGRFYASPLSPALAFVLVGGAQSARDYASERRLRQGITRAFSQYVSPVIVERLAANPSLLKLGGERRTLSILFCDVRGFTTISESMKDDPERLTRLINRLLDPLSQTVLDHGGTIDKYIGDAVMAFWNAPLDDPDHALHAVQAGLAMHEALERLNDELAQEATAEGKAPIALKIGVGVNTGDCVVGNMGSTIRFDYSVLGDAVNLASRLEGETKNFGVPLLVGEETARHFGTRLPLAPLERIKVKGKTEPVEVFAVLPGASDAALSKHLELIADLRAGQLSHADLQRALLGAELPGLREFYERLDERIRGKTAA